jgi:hypothetical protein
MSVRAVSRGPVGTAAAAPASPRKRIRRVRVVLVVALVALAGLMLTPSVFALLASLSPLDQLLAGRGIPVPDGQQHVRSPMNAGFPYSISALTEQAEAAATVFEVLVGREMQEAVAAGANPPLDPEVFESAAALDPVLQLFRPTELDQQWPKNPGGVLPVEGGSVNDTIERLVLDPTSDIDAELAALGQRYQAAWDAAVGDGTVDPAEFVQ